MRGYYLLTCLLHSAPCNSQLQQHIQRRYRVLRLKDEPHARIIAHLRSYRLLQKAVISIDCAGASLCEVEKVEAAFRHAAEVHRNHPTIQLIRTNTDEMVSSSDHPDTEVAAWIEFFFQ